MNGREGMVLRQAHPRMLFAMGAGGLELLVLVDAAKAGKVAQALGKADLWLKRAHYRR